MTTAPTQRSKSTVMRPVRRANAEYRIREHLTETEIEKLFAALKRNRHGHRDWLIGLVIYRHGLRVSEACDLRWDDVDLRSRTINIRRLKGSRGAPTTSNGMSNGGCAAYLTSRLMCSSTSAVIRSSVTDCPPNSTAGAAAELGLRFTSTCCAMLAAMPWRIRGWIRDRSSTISATRALPTR
jgi:hypothetical protein